MCTAFLDGLNGNVRHLVRAAVAQATPLACGETAYDIVYGGEESDANQLPILVVFRKSEYGMCYFYGT